MDNNVLIAVVSAVQLIIVGIVVAFFNNRGKQADARVQGILAEAQAETAQSTAGKQLFDMLSAEIDRQGRRIQQQTDELALVRQAAKEQTVEIEKQHGEITRLQGEVQMVQGELIEVHHERASSAALALRLQDELDQVRAALEEERRTTQALRQRLRRFERRVQKTGILGEEEKPNGRE